MVSASAHKLYGPKGIGLLYLRGGVRKLPISPIQFGGGQEFGLRPGTSNVPAIVGFAKAIELLETDREREPVEVRVDLTFEPEWKPSEDMRIALGLT